MVIPVPSRFVRQRGALMAELLVAIALLAIAVLPLAYSIASEKILARSYYERAVAMEIVDGEMEVLVAGEWRAFPAGQHDYTIRSEAATNLSSGKFLLTIASGEARLEWRPADKHHGGPVVRKAMVK